MAVLFTVVCILPMMPGDAAAGDVIFDEGMRSVKPLSSSVVKLS